VPEGNARSRRLTVPLVAALAVGAVLGGASGAGIAVLITQDSSQQTAAVTPQQGVVINNASAVTDISAVAAKASPSVVTIKVTTATSGGSGSGVIISSDGYIVTNAHVVTLSGATNEAIWQVEDSRGLLYNATMVGTDPTVDLAVLKVEGVTDWTPIEWADSGKLNVGDVTIAMGAPLGLAGTVTTGIISALNRSIQIGNSAVPDQSDSTTPDQENPFDFFQFDDGQGQGQTQSSQASITIPVIQTDAAINRGNSGGALLDSQGRLIGINVAIASAGSASSGGSIGVGFALPSNLAKRVTSEIIATGSATHGLLGASVSDQALQKDSTSVGAVVKEVVAGSAAEKAGIQPGDIVISVNGVPISSSSDLTATIRSLAAGTTTDLVIVRGGKPQTITVTLGTLK
jgi:putative serine protease PepD